MFSNQVKNEESIPYLDEILPDYQKRRSTTIDNAKAVQKDIAGDVSLNEISKEFKMRTYFEEYANNSSIHLFDHLVAPHRHPLEKFLTGIFILAGLACFIYASVVSWYWYQNNGFIILLDEQKELIRLVKPALLICPTNFIDESKFPATLKRYDIEDTPRTRQFFHILTTIKYYNMTNTPNYQAAPPELWIRILYDLKKDFYYETSLPGKGIWVVLEDGICFSVGNNIHPYASFENLLANKRPTTKLPTYPPNVADYQTMNKELDDPNYVPSYVYYPNKNITEYVKLDIDAWVELIDPMEYYKVKGIRHLTHPYEQLYTTLEVTLLLTTTATENVFSNKNRRKCGFHYDKGLELWPIYTSHLCAAEYRAQYVKKTCGCHPHFYPRMPGIPICNVTQLRCVKGNNVLFSRTPTMTRTNSPCVYNCNLVYFFQRTVKLQNVTSGNSTNMEIRIMFPQYKYSKKERFSFIDFMIAVGSVAGLFLGCSVLSGVEILYYATLHFYTNKHKYKQN